MTRDRSTEDRIATWLFDDAPEQLPERVLQRTFRRTELLRQRRSPGWRDLGMPHAARLIAIGGAAIAIALAAGFALLPRPVPSLGAGPSGSPAPSASPSVRASGSPTMPLALGGEIALTRTIDGNTDIYLTSDGVTIERLTTDPAEDNQYAWSPDGSTLLIGRRTSLEPEASEIYSLNLASGVETRLTSGGGRHANPVFSPDGNRIAYDRSPAEPGFHVMDADGTNDRLAFPIHDDQWNLQGSWASRSAVYAKRGEFDLLIVDLDTGVATTVVSGGPQIGDVGLSPDGSTFAFRSSSDSGGVFLMDADGGNVRHIVHSTSKGGLAWAPDGKHLILGQPDGWLYVVDLDGTNMTRWIEGASPGPRPRP